MDGWRARFSLTAPFASLALAAALAASPGCGPRYGRLEVHDQGGLSVTLRALEKRGQPMDRHFSHPLSIAGVRVAHILAGIDVRPSGEEERRAAVPVERLFEIGEAVSKAFARAESSQEVVVQLREQRRRLGIFSDEHLTSFVTWAEGDRLYIHFGYVDWPIPKGPDEKIPEPMVGRESKRFKLIAGDAMQPLGAQTLAVLWRDERFREASALRVGPGGRVVRRTILLENPADTGPAAAAAPAATLPENLSPETLRALADLEEGRRQGVLTEAEYEQQRRAILERAAPH